MIYNFDWDPNKALSNVRKHKVSFRQAMSVFSDPYQISVYDVEHSDDEDRWHTLGRDFAGNLLVVVHTAEETDNDLNIRIISARKASTTQRETYYEQYDR